MNLDQIATKCFILALFIRDDGERLLLGDGYYDFNQKLQHFQGNTIANDVVEIQGDNGQLLAGQVMRSGEQKFEGYIGDATTNRQTIEQKRSDFMAFFRIKHFYKVIYIFPDGTAIQRQRGYLTDAPTIPEIFQKFPEYSVALNFEDANYYEYAEDEHGDEIYAHIIELALSGNATGGLIWDAIGAVTNGITWSGIQTAQGEYISITNALDIPAKLASVEMLGNATQDGTPTPDSPIPVRVVTGEQTVMIEGKNLCYRANLKDAQDIEFYFSGLRSRTFTLAFTTNETLNNNSIYLRNVGNTQWHNWGIIGTASGSAGTRVSCTITLTEQIYSELQDVTKAGGVPLLMLYKSGANFQVPNDAQLELGSTATAYEPYQGQSYEINLGGTNKFNFDDYTLTEARITADYDANSATLTATGESGTQYLRAQFSGYDATKTYTFSGKAKKIIKDTSGQNFIWVRWRGSNDGGSTWGSYASLYQNASPTVGTEYTYSGQITGYSTYQIYLYGNNSAPSQSVEKTSYYSIMLNEGSVALPFVPYTTYAYELAKIPGTNYRDRFYPQDGKWYIEKQVGKYSVSLTGLYTLTGGLKGAICSPANKATSGGDALCDRAVKTVGGNIWAGSFYENPASFMFVGTADDDATSIKSKYDGAILYYALATPTTTEITNEALIAQLDALESASLYLGLNNIGTETLNAVPTLKIEYYTEVDLDGAGYEWEPGGNTAKTIVTVAGVDSAWPIWTIQGGAQNPTLTNITTGQTISWQGFVPEGQTLTINMAEMTADLAGANVFEYITGEWIRLAPGNNTLVYTAGSATEPSTLSWNGVLA